MSQYQEQLSFKIAAITLMFMTLIALDRYDGADEDANIEYVSLSMFSFPTIFLAKMSQTKQNKNNFVCYVIDDR